MPSPPCGHEKRLPSSLEEGYLYEIQPRRAVPGIVALVVIGQQDGQRGLCVLVCRLDVPIPVVVANDLTVALEHQLGDAAKVYAVYAGLFVMLHPKMKIAFSYLDAAFVPHCSVLLCFFPFGMYIYHSEALEYQAISEMYSTQTFERKCVELMPRQLV